MTSKTTSLRAQSFPLGKSFSAGLHKKSRIFLVLCALLLVFLFLSSVRDSDDIPLEPHLLHGYRLTGRSFHHATYEVVQTKAIEDLLQKESTKMDGFVQCDRSHYRTDVCVARGDVRVLACRSPFHGSKCRDGYRILVFTNFAKEKVERVKPYTRKWEDNVMDTIDEVQIIRRRISRQPDEGIDRSRQHEFVSPGRRRRDGFDITPLQDMGSINVTDPYHKAVKQKRKQKSRKVRQGAHTRRDECDVHHEVPAIVFSTGGYTGNVYHEFNDGLIPLYITVQQIASAPGEVVLVILEYHPWWMTKYSQIIKQITNHEVVDLAGDKRTHCFRELTVGLQIHDELSIDSKASRGKPSMEGFQRLLHAAYGGVSADGRKQSTLRSTMLSSAIPANIQRPVPKLVIISRTRSRKLLNQRQLISLARGLGFSVKVLSPKPWTRMEDMYAELSSCDVMIGVHGAAMTHLLFMRPGSTFIQVVPLGTDWAAETYYGEPARKLGLHYVQYKISPQESSLWKHYGPTDPVLMDPESVNRRGWWETKRIYLERQNVTISLPDMAAILRSAYARAINVTLMQD
ncbi:hypothetical protein KP509_30G049600 [Ceratopteris richardii]|uniref:Glycosyltransferase 61 catalytic domain-containing protein n=1 Tax=Ceratopteris richardii TaxID=49495 RepID=A0A8T2R4E6_CERRI|nr:hypothetical protein KP509_30G049600 [Ceratopteris richardii]